MQVLHSRYLSVARRALVLLGIAGTIALPLVHLELPPAISASPEALRLAVVWTWAAVLAIIAFGIERRSLKFFHLRGFRPYDVVEVFAAMFLALMLAAAIRSFLPSAAPVVSDDDTEPAALWIRLAVAVTAGITEEFSYRGFLIEEGGALIRNRYVAGILSTLAFAAGHSDRGWTAAFLGPGVIGAALTISYFRRKSLPLCMLMHAFLDVCYELVH
jgi:membrane protease YdiL (CAAX protease family)